MKKLKTYALWALQILFSILMILSGINKFTIPGWVERFQDWGYFDGFVYIIGVLEIIGGAALLIPRTASYAGVLLGIIMIGAIITQALSGMGIVGIIVHLVYIIAYFSIAWIRRPGYLRKVAVA